MAKREDREVSFPLTEAVAFSLESIRRRFTRAFITVISIVLGIAFRVALLTLSNIAFAVNPSQQTSSIQLWMQMIALLVCGVGIVNSMLMSVTERYKEIGTIKTLGAMDIHVLEIFIIEALLLGIIGGAIGGIGGWSAALVISYISPPANVQPSMVIGPALQSLYLMGEAVLLSMLLTLVSAIAPSYLAAKLSPSEALRYEV